MAASWTSRSAGSNSNRWPNLVLRTLDCARALRDAELRPADVRGVVMVGGATRMPVIRAAVGEMFGTTPLTDLIPIRWSRWAPRCRRTCWPATGRRAKTGCCWM